MKLLTLLFALLATSIAKQRTISVDIFSSDLHRNKPSKAELPSNIITFEIEQNVDNFNPINQQTFNQRYFENPEFFSPGGPIFIFLYNADIEQEVDLSTGHMHDMAEVLNGTMFQIEYRYHGLSQPTEDLSTENLRFLSSDQILVDLVKIIEEIKSREGYEDSGVILVGADVGGTYAAWFAKRYPHLINGVWASSARLQTMVGGGSQAEIADAAYRYFGTENCVDIIETAISQMESLVVSGDTEEIIESFQLCVDVPSTRGILDIWGFFSAVSVPFYYYTESQSFINNNIAESCDYLESNFNGSYIEVLGKHMMNYLGFPDGRLPGGACLLLGFDNTLEMYRNLQFSPNRQTMFMRCIELGWFFNSGNNDTMFGSFFSYEWILDFCAELFDGRFTVESVVRDVNFRNVLNGGRNAVIPNIYYTYGEFDKWRAYGVEVNKHTLIDIIPETARLAELASVSNEDSPELKRVRRRIFNLVKKWLKL